MIFAIFLILCYYICGDFMDYQNKIILITGAYRGIGKSLCNFFAQRHANLIITYHSHREETLMLKEELERLYNINVMMYYLDLCDEESIKKLYLDIESKYNNIDVLINNAALSLDNDILSKTKDEFMKVLEVNVLGTFLMMRYFDNIVNGYIFNISSTDGIDTGNIYSIDYNVSKAGINNMTKTFSMYSNNKIISICPNWVDTESTRGMDDNYLKNELTRIKQKKLIDKKMIAVTIDKCIKNNIESGSIIRIDGDENEF